MGFGYLWFCELTGWGLLRPPVLRTEQVAIAPRYGRKSHWINDDVLFIRCEWIRIIYVNILLILLKFRVFES